MGNSTMLDQFDLLPSNLSLNITLYNAEITNQSNVVFWYATTMFISFLASLLLLLVLLATATNKHLQSPSCLLTGHLFLVELIMSAFIYPMLASLQFTYAPPVKTVLHCKTLFIMMPLVQIAGLWSTLGIAVNRFIAIIHPSFYTSVSSHKALVSNILGSWLVGFW